MQIHKFQTNTFFLKCAYATLNVCFFFHEKEDPHILYEIVYSPLLAHIFYTKYDFSIKELHVSHEHGFLWECSYPFVIV